VALGTDPRFQGDAMKLRLWGVATGGSSTAVGNMPRRAVVGLHFEIRRVNCIRPSWWRIFGLCLHQFFQPNKGGRRFYEARGFCRLQFNAGAGNQERMSGIRYRRECPARLESVPNQGSGGSRTT
jgi:hypothetical protein